MSQMLDPEKINKILSEFHRPEMLTGIKVTTEFAHYLKQTIPPLPKKPNRLTYSPVESFASVPVEIDDEIDGLYELVFNKESQDDIMEVYDKFLKEKILWNVELLK